MSNFKMISEFFGDASSTSFDFAIAFDGIKSKILFQTENDRDWFHKKLSERNRNVILKLNKVKGKWLSNKKENRKTK